MLIQQGKDQKIIADYVENLSAKSKQELVAIYNKQEKLGIVGVRQQTLYLVALGKVFKQVFGDSPVYFEDSIFLGMKGQIILVDETYIQLAEYPDN